MNDLNIAIYCVSALSLH